MSEFSIHGSHLVAYPCPVCGYLVFDGPPGSYNVCPICYWEDDIVQLAFPLMEGGANRISLYDAQKEFDRYGASESRFVERVRAPVQADRRDPQWRQFEPMHDPHLDWECEADRERWKVSYNGTGLYYWRKDYWLAASV
jgi:hypothetical protein